MEKNIMTPERLRTSLAILDLTDPRNGLHVVNLAIEKIYGCLAAMPGWPKPEIKRSPPTTTLIKNYDRLLFPTDNAGRSSRYTRYVSDELILRTHTSEMIPGLLDELPAETDDYLVMCPGICYRRDVVDMTHCAEPHQMDIWRIAKKAPRLTRPDLLKMIDSILSTLLPGMSYRVNETTHPYTINGLEVEVLRSNGEWLELLECGEAHPEILKNSGLNQNYSGLAMGIGLDRLAMLIKGIDDIRLLRSEDPRIKKQMTNLSPYQPVSKYPLVRQDMSVSVSLETNEEDVCESLKDALGADSEVIEEIVITSETTYENLPAKAIERLGIVPGQKNLLIRVILRSPERSLTHEEANDMRNKMYRAIDQSVTGGYVGK